MGMDMKGALNDLGNPDLLRSWVVHALTAASQGEMEPYEQFLSNFVDAQLDDSASDCLLKCLLKALSQSVSFINEVNHEALLSAVLGMSLWMHSLEVADVLVEFLVNLATANGGCLGQCLDMLVRSFLPPSCGLPVFIDSFSRRALMKGWSKEILIQRKDDHMAKKDAVMQRVHFAIERLAELVPITVLHLQRIVLQRMPHRIVDKEWNALYLENMLQLETFSAGEFIGTQMLMAVVDRLIEIDVEIRWEDIIGEDDNSKAFIFEMDLDDESEDDEGGELPMDLAAPGSEVKLQLGLTSKPIGRKKQNLGAMADKMDMLMDMALAHLQSCAANGRTAQVFRTLMKSFQSTILDTYKSKFTQFLIFYLCSLDPTSCGADFASLLHNILTCKERPPNTRMSAAAYLASYISRAKYLPLSIVSSSVKKLVEWCVNYTPRQNDKKNTLSVDAGTNGVFYAACQAAMYVLCFRMKSLVDDPRQVNELRCLPLEQLVKHSLDPLKLCLPSVVEEFMKQARTTKLLVESLSSLERIGKFELHPSSTFGGINRLDMFFPFDPYLLKRSDRFIRPNFIFWSMVQSQEEEVENEDDNRRGSFVENGKDGIVHSQDSNGIVLLHDSQKKHNRLHSASKVGVEYDRGYADCHSDDDSALDIFESSLNRMSITPGDVVSVLPAKLTAKALPLPARLLSF